MKKRVIIIPAVIVVGVAALGIAVASMGNGNTNGAANISYLEKKTLQNVISVSGTVESTNNTKVFSYLNNNIEAVNVAVGDKVKKGDVLCTLNTDELQNQILQQQAVVDSSNVTSGYQLTDAEKNYQDALEKLNLGTNSQIASAKQALDNAKLALDIAQNNYDNAVNGTNADSDTQIRTAELALNNAEESVRYNKENYYAIKKEVEAEDYYTIRDLKKEYDDAQKSVDDYRGTLNKNSDIAKARDDAKTAYEKAKKGIDDTNNTKLENAYQALKNAEQTLENAKLSLETAKNSSDLSDKNNANTIKDFKNQLTNAQLTYENAKSSYNLALKEAEANVSSLKASADRERTLSGNNDSQLILLESYKSKLEYAVITAPCDGTITNVNAAAGSVPTGELFVIEDTESLKITASVSEYDITSIELGMPIIIKSDAVKGKEYEGTISKISPTAAVNTNSNATFAIEVTVLSQNTELKIGMTAKLSIITEKTEDVFAVMYDLISVDSDGNDIIYTAEKTDTGYVAKAIKVTVGMETDFEAEISSDELIAGMIVIKEPDMVSDGNAVTIEEVSATDVK